MLRRLFHRESPVVTGMNLAGFVLGLWSMGVPRPWLHTLALLQFCFINGCAYFPFYRGIGAKGDHTLGIRLHFWKARVPVAYIAPFHILLTLWLGGWTIPLVVNVLYAVISLSNLALIYLHFRDPHLEPPNLYSTGRYH